MAEYLEDELIEVYTTDWVDITDYVVEDIESQWGIQGNTPADRVASTGQMTITLNNASGIFSPGTLNVLPGFTKGIRIRYTQTFDAEPYIRFYGIIDSIEVESGSTGTQRVTVKCLDWIELLARHRLVGFGLDINADISSAMTTILNSMAIQPLSTSFQTGVETFPTVFDTVTPTTVALSEATKLALSEMGYIYLRRLRTTGEQLVVEARNTRDSLDVKRIPKKRSESGFLKLESGDFLLKEDAGKLILNATQSLEFNNTMVSLKTNFGSGILNDINFVSNPRRVDTSVQVLFSTGERIALAAGEIKDNITVEYKDPSGGAIKVNANPATMLTPVSGTDFTMFENSDGTGTNLTANLSVTATYSTDGITYSIHNTGATDGYVYLQFRGYGIYVQDPARYRAFDQTSIDEFGYKSITIDQKYTSDPFVSAGLANVLLNVSLDPKTEVQSMDFIANGSDVLMLAYLYLDIGDMVYIRESKTGVDGVYAIQNIKFKVTVEGIIYCTYGLVRVVSLEPNAWLLEIDGRSELNETTIIG